MTDQNTTSKDPDKLGGAKRAAEIKSARAPEEKRSRSDERRFLDALEDDEVREALRALRKHNP